MSTPAAPPLRVGIMLPTHNRREDLARTLAVLETLQPPPHEILITADGCSDGTAEWLATQPGPYRLFTHSPGKGSCTSRDIMLRATTSDVILSLDDDSYPLETDAMARLAKLFAENSRLAVADFPQRTDEYPETLMAADLGESGFLASYTSASAALRVAPFAELGGYSDIFWHVYEEPDYALRCVVAGWEVRKEMAITIRHHFTGVGRNEMRNHQLHARNEFWSILMRCPAVLLPAVVVFRLVRQAGYARLRGMDWLQQEPRWWLQAWRGAAAAWARRRPLSVRGYLGWMRLTRRPTANREEFRRLFGVAP